MLQELTFTPATAVVAVAIIVGIVLAARRLLRRGLCDCNDKCGGCEGCSKAASCTDGSRGAGVRGDRSSPIGGLGCPAAQTIVQRLEKL